MTERQLAENICRVHARSVVDSLGGITIGGASLGEAYAAQLNKAGGYDLKEVTEIETALRHWVSSAGYDKNGKFHCVFASTIQNC